MATLKFKFNLFELANHSERITSISALESHPLVVGSIEKEGKYPTAGWLKSLSMQGDTLVASVLPACEDDNFDFERTIYNPRLVHPNNCPRCVLDSNHDSLEYIFGCDETHVWTSCGMFPISEVNLLAKVKEG